MKEQRQSAKSIREYYDTFRDKELAELRSLCEHNDVSDWADEWWAIGHSTGFQVKYCKICEVTLNRKTNCHKCGREIADNEIFKGDGKKLPLGGYYCKDCYNSAINNMSLYEVLVKSIPINKNTYLERWKLYNSMKVSKAEVCKKLDMTEQQVREMCSSEFREILKYEKIKKY